MLLLRLFICCVFMGNINFAQAEFDVGDDAGECGCCHTTSGVAAGAIVGAMLLTASGIGIFYANAISPEYSCKGDALCCQKNVLASGIEPVACELQVTKKPTCVANFYPYCATKEGYEVAPERRKMAAVSALTISCLGLIAGFVTMWGTVASALSLPH